MIRLILITLAPSVDADVISSNNKLFWVGVDSERKPKACYSNRGKGKVIYINS